MTKIDDLINDTLRWYDDDDRFEIKFPWLKRILVKIAEDIKALQSSEVDVDKIMEILSLRYVVDRYWQEHYNFTEERLKEILLRHLSTSKVKEEVEIKKYICRKCNDTTTSSFENRCRKCWEMKIID